MSWQQEKRNKPSYITRAAMLNNAKVVKSKQEQWVQEYPDPTLVKIENKPDHSVHCKGDLRSHLKSNKHPKNVKAFKKRKNQKQTQLHSLKSVTLL